ncbi:MAG: hypothetical protein WBE68_23120 [Candidatus Nitrosopolaris sp.]
MTCLIAYHNKKGTKDISIVLQTRLHDTLEDNGINTLLAMEAAQV